VRVCSDLLKDVPYPHFTFRVSGMPMKTVDWLRSARPLNRMFP
jgi:hypothetical protein